MNLTQKIIAAHAGGACPAAGETVRVRMDQTLTQDALGMLAYMAFEQMGLERVRTELSVSYIDHNLLYTDFRNPDDHAYLLSVARKYGICVSRAGNGICHLVHAARFSKPGKTVIGTDSHTPTAGAVGMLGIGAGGMEVAAVMAGEPLTISMPRVIRVNVRGCLRGGVNAKDAALCLLARLTVKGGTGCALEYADEGLAGLSVPQRMTLANMGVETGATTSIFPSDEQTRLYLTAHSRAGDYIPLAADSDACYDKTIDLDLSMVVPMIALPHQPDRAVPVTEAEKKPVDQVFIGSCTNSSYSDLLRAAQVLKGRRAAPGVSLVIGIGTRETYLALLKTDAIRIFLEAGARILECGCGPCVGMGQAVRSGGVSVRTSNRNFKGRCGTADSFVYLAGPETAAACAVLGRIGGAEELMDTALLTDVQEPSITSGDDGMLIINNGASPDTRVLHGPNIKEIPMGAPLPAEIRALVVIRVGDNVSTDEIAPSGEKNVANRANIEAVSRSTFERTDPGFAQRALAAGSSIIVAGDNYGQGSSREHAALMPMYLGVRAVLAKSFARIHRANLINFGLLPLEFERAAHYDALNAGDMLVLPCLSKALESGGLTITNLTTGQEFPARLNVSPYEREVLRAGGLLQYINKRKEGIP